MANDLLHINEGITTRHLYKGVIAAFIGLMVLLQGSVYVAYVIWFFSICLVLSVEGLTLDFNERKMKRYTHFLFFKYGKWVELKDYDRVGISLYKAVNRRMTRTSYSTTQTKSYELVLETAGGENVEILEHPDYDKIVSVGLKLSDGLGIPLVNYFQAQRDAAMRRPRRR